MRTPPNITASIAPFVEDNTNYGLALQTRLADQDANTNRFLSPYSIGIALAMTDAGSTKTDHSIPSRLARYARFPSHGASRPEHRERAQQ